ncbi:hypothetical protein SAMN05216337_1017109 [Bradyrhizobium brasilense]|uniref:Uncharacterized protein n=1 Tax=Bradyrhizobium brasilense TaxID=1419277 RepID=A0A1G6YVF0_9BRAD|nr:hypothetical protein [Bradyrhizobium brasilense]SDD94320.1 hypothetical protein SAMN05216337_1017109 [Bradyrhizobium brasilense]
MSDAQIRAPDAPFWSDNFDMDLPKVFPEARELLGDLADVEMWTGGRPDANGRLNHPACWNTDIGLAAFFGFKNTGRDENYMVCRERVRCTAWEAFRDAWAHQFVMVVENKVVWHANRLWHPFEIIMWNKRGWGDGSKQVNEKAARRQARGSYRDPIRLFGNVVELHGMRGSR